MQLPYLLLTMVEPSYVVVRCKHDFVQSKVLRSCLRWVLGPVACFACDPMSWPFCGQVVHSSKQWSFQIQKNFGIKLQGYLDTQQMNYVLQVGPEGFRPNQPSFLLLVMALNRAVHGRHVERKLMLHYASRKGFAGC